MKALLMLLVVGFFSISLAIENSGFIKKLTGEAIIKRDNKIIIVKTGVKIYPKDIIITKNNSSVGIIFKDNTLISLGKNTEFIIEEYTFNPEEKQEAFISRITKGTLSCLTGLMPKLNPDAMKIKAKTASIGIRGTHFLISVD
ncbi:FecR family protein [Arcobacter arenosus]|uniref:FecR domain-containing protein n=1 Tax=Arcobacter arenosus TaxID=2576037 RepID=A0A5R8Y038_9BACT|nr:FecR domain-containing protein [Arcobacter arenosus]TLP37621.1 FecR domain-containing protein [Arcobacter arenosus]